MTDRIRLAQSTPSSKVEREYLSFEHVYDITESTGFRVYVTPSGEKYPSVTTILSSFKKEGLDEWRQKVGEAEAAKITSYATRRGSLVHQIFEDYILKDEIFLSDYNPVAVSLFMQGKSLLDKNLTKVYGVESGLYSHRLKTAGRCDLICQWKGENAILDYKTSKKKKREEWIEDYFIQKTIYAMMMFELFGLKFQKIVTFILVENEHEPQVFEKETKDYIGKALKKIKDYYENINTVV